MDIDYGENMSKSTNTGRASIPQSLVDWLRSEDGQQGVLSAIHKAQSDVLRLNMAKRIKPEHLHIPMM